MSVTNINAMDETEAQIASTVARLKDHFVRGENDLNWRTRQLKQLRKLVTENQSAIAEALKKDLNKGEVEAYTSEIGFVIGDIDHTLKHLKKWMRPRKVSTPIVAQPGTSFKMPEPLGTVLIIGAWNYPFQLVLAPLVAAIAAGNHAILKPSELSAHTSALIAKLVPRYLDSHAFAVVEGAVNETTALLKQQFDHILYTGGEQVGKIVMRAASEHLTPVTLELGGKSPCIVEGSADMSVTAARIAWAKWMNAGQTCTAPDYVLVEKEYEGELIEQLKRHISKFYGDDIEQSADYGRIINERHHQRLVNYLDGQQIAFGGDRNDEDKYLGPTLVSDPDPDSPLMQEEIFGPILPILTVESMDEAVAFVNRRAKPLALYVFTNRESVKQQVIEQTSAGSMCVNDGFMFMVNPELPFGGVGNSGMGSYHGRDGFDTFSHLKSVMKRGFRFDVPLRYPPFNKFKFSWLKRLL